MASFDDLFGTLPSEAGPRGRAFERVCQWYLRNAPRYRSLLINVWLWDDWPGRWSADAGIDLVAQTKSGDLWAIQAKAYGPQHRITKAGVDSFLSESGREVFQYRLLIGTTDLIGRTALRTMNRRNQHEMTEEEIPINVDCSEYLDDVRALGSSSSPLAMEQILTKARLPVILDNLRPKTLIYTHYVSGIDKELYDAVAAKGFSVGFYTGDDKTGLDAFIDGDLDVLIGSGAIGTGVDRLQEVCRRLIINVLPWTAAEYEQLKGRIYRQGQREDKVEIILPLTYADVNGERWSWCEMKRNRLNFKKSIADAAVDSPSSGVWAMSPAAMAAFDISWI